MIDILIRNARLSVDSGIQDWVDIAISDREIVTIGRNQSLSAEHIIEAEGALLTPGFVDTHTHDDLAILANPYHEPKLLQGVTSVVLGNCGHGCAPVAGNYKELQEYSGPVLGDFPGKFQWSTFGEYLQTLNSSATSINTMSLVPHGALRASIMGFEAREATQQEISKMASMMGDAMQEGAVGVSLGLMYAPGCFASHEELVAIAEEVGKYDGVLACHMRNEGSRLLDSINETANIGVRADVRIHISHLKAIGLSNHGKIPLALEQLDNLRERGVDVTCDVYPYSAGSTTITSLMPPWSLRGGTHQLLKRLRSTEDRERIKSCLNASWGEMENHLLGTGAESTHICGLSHPDFKEHEGRSLLEIARTEDLGIEECLLELISKERGQANVIMFQMSDQDVEQALQWPWSMIGSDGLPLSSGSLHPRHYGTFPRVLSRYTREKCKMSLDQAIHKMTSFPARRFGLKRRGEVREGALADLVLFEPEVIEDLATYERPRKYPKGIRAVIVNGELAASMGAPTGRLAGEQLWGNGV